MRSIVNNGIEIIESNVEAEINCPYAWSWFGNCRQDHALAVKEFPNQMRFVRSAWGERFPHEQKEIASSSRQWRNSSQWQTAEGRFETCPYRIKPNKKNPWLRS